MSRSTQRLDGLATDQSGSTSHCDSHDRTFSIRISQHLIWREYHFIGRGVREVMLHRLARRGTAAPNGTLLIAKACSRISRPVSPSRGELVTRRWVGRMVGS